jgi:hypothetical protein
MTSMPRHSLHIACRLTNYLSLANWKDEWGYLSYLHDGILLYARGEACCPLRAASELTHIVYGVQR